MLVSSFLSGFCPVKLNTSIPFPIYKNGVYSSRKFKIYYSPWHIFKCIKILYPHDVNLHLYQVHAVTEGTDAQATVSVRIEEKGKTTVGQAADTDTLVASANAYIAALNKMIIKREKTAPMMEQVKEKVRGI